MKQPKICPIMQFGKYRGIQMDKLPMSYLRWMLGQAFPIEYLEYAKWKVEQNKSSDIEMDVSRHAIDSFSLRFFSIWVIKCHKNEGIGSFLARYALQALSFGEDVSKNRHQDENIIKLYDGMRFVFSRSIDFPTLITVMPNE